MIDQKKRRTLAIIGGTTASLAIPSMALSNPLPVTSTDMRVPDNQDLSQLAVRQSVSNPDLQIFLSLDNEPVVQFRNNTDKVIILKHVYPGIVHVGSLTFDINSVFEKSAYAIGARRSRKVRISPTFSTQAETQFPRHLQANKPIKVAMLTAEENSKQLAYSTRTYFS